MLVNVAVADPAHLATAVAIWDEVALVESELGTDGRVLLRPSGTEPLVRVMAEAPTPELAKQVVDRLVTVVRREPEHMSARSQHLGSGKAAGHPPTQAGLWSKSLV